MSGSIKKVISLVACLATIISCFSACQTTGDELYRNATASSNIKNLPADIPEEYKSDVKLTPAPSDELSGELTVKTYWFRGNPPTIYLLAEEFMKLHPKVSINFDYEIDNSGYRILSREEEKNLYSSYSQRLLTELVSGEADYLLFNVSEQMNTYQLSKNGVLKDLSAYWENDPDINPNNYFTQVLDAYKADGKMTVLPMNFICTGFFLNKSTLKEIGIDLKDTLSVSSNNILDWYEKARESGPELQLFFSAPGKDTLFEVEKYGCIDWDREMASFDSPEFLNYLERTNAAINHDPDLDEYAMGMCYGALANCVLKYQDTEEFGPNIFLLDDPKINWPHNIVTKGKTSFATLQSLDMVSLAYMQQSMEYMEGPFLATSSDGKYGLSSNEDFAIPSGCKNPELAWEFIKYCISDREDLSFSNIGYKLESVSTKIPINKNTFSMMAENLSIFLNRYTTPGVGAFDTIDGDELTKQFDKILTENGVSAKKYGIDLSEFLDEYYVKGLINAEECAKRMQERTEIWLSE